MSRSRRAPRQRAGFTVIELAIVVVIMAVIGRSMSLVSRTSEQAFELTRATNDVELRAGLAASAIQAELESAAIATIVMVEDPDTGATEISYQRLEDWSAGAPVLSDRRILRMELDPGEVADGGDDDGDGLVDEGQIVLVENAGSADETTRVIARGVRVRMQGEIVNGEDDNGNGLVDEPGFAITRVRTVLRVQATFVGPIEGHPTGVLRTIDQSVMLRN